MIYLVIALMAGVVGGVYGFAAGENQGFWNGVQAANRIAERQFEETLTKFRVLPKCAPQEDKQ